MITIHNLNFSYKPAQPILNNIDLFFESGRIYGFLGKNGSGKTSLLKLMRGLLFPTSGSCQVFGVESRHRDPLASARCYHLPEELYVPAVSGKTYLKIFAAFYPHFDKIFFNKALTEFGLDQKTLLTSFSLGQKKKFMLSFALATNTEILILDEPTNGLDIPSKTLFRKLVTESFTENKTYIISTHQVHDVEHLIDSIIVIDNGEIILATDLAKVSANLLFQDETVEPNGNDLLYYEIRLGRFYTVRAASSTEHESHIDLEALFNTIITQPKKVSAIFNKRLST